MQGVAILYQVGGKVLTIKVTLDQRPEGSLNIPRDEVFQAEVTAYANNKGQLVQQVQETAIF